MKGRPTGVWRKVRLVYSPPNVCCCCFSFSKFGQNSSAVQLPPNISELLSPVSEAIRSEELSV